MIIPVKCFTCGNVLADKYRYYQSEVRRIKLLQGANVDKVIYLTKDNTEKTVEGNILDDLGLKSMCCRRHMLTHVDIE
jgi:DNA-directed RNA polymerase subunit N (RpoN/RPB10)